MYLTFGFSHEFHTIRWNPSGFFELSFESSHAARNSELERDTFFPPLDDKRDCHGHASGADMESQVGIAGSTPVQVAGTGTN